jgi:N-carbamoylputrescine amidase
VFVAAPNRIGHEGEARSGIEFWGQSFICDPAGKIMAKGSADKEETVMAECDFAKIDVQRTHWPFLRDRRIDAYHGILKRYGDHDDS